MLSLRDRTVLNMTISEHFERFQYFNFATNFLENEIFFEKMEHRFLIESTEIESATFPHKTADSSKWTYHKERSFASNSFIF